MKTPREALEKIDHTVCLAFNENNNAIFNKDKYESIDCKDIYEFVECYEVLDNLVDIWEIIKKKNIDIVYLRWECNCAEDYNNNPCFEVNEEDKLTEEEFNLIKEKIND